MSRPEHPGVPIPASCIHDLRVRQELYDADPEGYERRELERKEEAMREEEERRRWEQEVQNRE